MNEGASTTEPDRRVCEHYQRAAEIIGRRWNPQIVQVLLRGTCRYRDVKAAVAGISDHILSDRLRSLEAEGIVRREVTPDTPVRITYGLTEAGEGLAEAIGALAEWAERWARQGEPAVSSH
jgi:DNA-binding HxlR family transcriptional regulator